MKTIKRLIIPFLVLVTYSILVFFLVWVDKGPGEPFFTWGWVIHLFEFPWVIPTILTIVSFLLALIFKHIAAKIPAILLTILYVFVIITFFFTYGQMMANSNKGISYCAKIYPQAPQAIEYNGHTYGIEKGSYNANTKKCNGYSMNPIKSLEDPKYFKVVKTISVGKVYQQFEYGSSNGKDFSLFPPDQSVPRFLKLYIDQPGRPENEAVMIHYSLQ